MGHLPAEGGLLDVGFGDGGHAAPTPWARSGDFRGPATNSPGYRGCTVQLSQGTRRPAQCVVVVALPQPSVKRRPSPIPNAPGTSFGSSPLVEAIKTPPLTNLIVMFSGTIQECAFRALSVNAPIEQGLLVVILRSVATKNLKPMPEDNLPLYPPRRIHSTSFRSE